MIRAAVINTVAVLTLVSAAHGQGPVMSPRDSARIVFDGKKISILYGKPSIRGRQIFGDVVPYYKVWRTGAGEATVLRTDADLEMDGAIVPRGAYSIYTIPAEHRWKVILNKQTGQWGTVYNSQLDLARIEVTPRVLKSLVQDLRFRLERTDNESGTLRIEWERTSVVVPFRVSKDSLVPSPRDSAELHLEGARIAVNYGRPSMRGRKIVGGVVPYDKVWRTGANEATGFVTSSDLIIGGVTVPHGAYTLYSLPTRSRWLLIINKQTGQWGTVYDPNRDLARFPMKRRALKSPVEKFTIDLRATGSGSGVLSLQWEKTEVSVNFTVK